MANQDRNRAYHRDAKRKKYFSRLKENKYWLWTDAHDQLVKSWTDLIEGCKFAKKFKNGGSPEKRSDWDKIWRKRQSDKRHAYPQDKIVMDDEEIRMITSTNWESFCGSCDNFNTELCPLLNQVDITTNWKEDINCGKFMD